MGRLAVALGALFFGLGTGVAAAAGTTITTTTTGPARTVSTTVSTTVTEPPTTSTVTRTATGAERTVTAPEPKTTTSVVATTPATKTSGSSVPAWAWVVIALGAVGIVTSIYMVGRDRGRRREATGPDRRKGGAPYDPDPPAR